MDSSILQCCRARLRWILQTGEDIDEVLRDYRNYLPPPAHGNQALDSAIVSVRSPKP